MIAFPESSAIEAYDYDAERKRLIVRTKWGRDYTYDEVPDYIVDQFVNAKSAGHYYHSIIKKFFKERQDVQDND